MKYNNPGKTGIKISKLGFGVARLPEIKVGDEYFLENETVYDMVVLAVEKGINYFDPGDIYCHGQSQRAVSSALKEYRDDVYLANKIMTNKRKNKGDLIKNIQSLLNELGQEYFDFFYFWGINKKEFDNVILKKGFLEEAVAAKEDGLIRHIGFSFHDAPEALKYIVDTTDIFEVVSTIYILTRLRG